MATNDLPDTDGHLELVTNKARSLPHSQESQEHQKEEKAFEIMRKETGASRTERKEMTRNAEEDSKSDLEHILNDVVLNVKKTWHAVKDITGYDFGIIPPISLSSPPQVVGHWINLSTGIVPFEYVTKNSEIINENKDCQGGQQNIKLDSLTSALLITEYVNCVIRQMEIEPNDEIKDVTNLLKELYTLLQSVKKDIDLVMSSKETENVFSTMSKMKDITENLLHISPVNGINQSTPKVCMLTVTECDLLCRIVGLEPEFADKMIDIDHTLVLHRSPLYFIEIVLEDEMEEKVSNRSNQVESDFKSDLSLLGFSQEKSQEIANSINSNFHKMYSPIYWANVYLEDVFSSHPLLTFKPIFDKHADKPFDTWYNDEAELSLVLKKKPTKTSFTDD